MLKRVVLLLGLLSGSAFAQTPTPAQLGLVVATPNVVQVLDSTKTWSSIGTINPATHAFTPIGVPPAYTLPTASTTVLGGVKVDGTTITATGGGVISAAIPPATPPGGTSGQIQFNSGGSAFGGFTASGDATINTATGAVAVTKTGGTAFGALATVAPGTGVATAAAAAVNTNGGMALVNGSPVVGNSLKWSATGIQDAGALGAAVTVQRFTVLGQLNGAQTPVCQVNGCTPTGTGYGATVTGTMTLTTNSGKFVCSTYPVLNVTTNAGGNISTVSSIATAGSCTTIGATPDEVWTPGGSLSAGSGALFALNWNGINQLYIPTAGMKYAMVYAYSSAGQGGGGSSVTSGTAASGGAGGGGASMNQCFVSATQVGVSQIVNVGVGGHNGGNPAITASANGSTGAQGQSTTFGVGGSMPCRSWGGGGGFGGIAAATLAGGGAGGSLNLLGVNGSSGANGIGSSGGSGNGGGATSWPIAGGGMGGGQGSATGLAVAGAPGVLAGAGGGGGGGLTTAPATNSGGVGGQSIINGTPTTAGSAGGANTSGGTGPSQPNSMPNVECGSGGGGGGSGLTTTVAGNGGAGALCSGGAGAGSVVNGAGSAPGFGGPGGDGVLDVVEYH